MKTVAWWKYNPLLEKPTHLEPVYPGSLYYYYGPDPAAGISYGKYLDKENDVTFILQEQDKEVLSPFSGKPMEKAESMTKDEAEAFVSNLKVLHGYDSEEKAEGMHIYKAEQAVANLDKKENKAMSDLKALKRHQRLKAKIKAKIALADDEEVVDESPAEEPADLSLDDDSASEDVVSLDDPAPSEDSDSVETPTEDQEETIDINYILDVLNGQGDLGGESVESKVEAVKKVLSDTFVAKASNDGELIDLEKLLKTIRSKAMANVKERQKKTVKEKIIAKARKRKIIASLRKKKEEAKAEAKAKPQAKTQKVEAKEKALARREEIKKKIEARRKAEAEAQAKKQRLEDFKARVKAKKEAEAKTKAKAEAKNTQENKAEAKEKAEAEAKKARIEKIKAIIAKKKAEKEEAKKAKKAKKEASEEAEGCGTMAKKEAKAEAKDERVLDSDANIEAKHDKEMEDQHNDVPKDAKKDLDKAKNEGMGQEMMHHLHAEVEDASEDLRFETIASMEVLAEASRSEMDMVLYGEQTENPAWLFTVKASPVARIELSDQPDADKIRKVFCSDDYATTLMDHCVDSGVAKALSKVNASFFANQISDKEIANKFKSLAERMVEDEKAKVLASFSEDFLNCISVVTAGMNKNFYPELGNPLKEALYANMTTAGLPEGTAQSVIEKSFGEGSSAYYNALFEQAKEYMGLSREARAEIAKAISASSTLNHSSDNVIAEHPATLHERLVKASAVASVNAGTPALTVRDDSVSIDVNDYKNEMKNLWKKN